VKIHQDATFYVASLQPGQELTHTLGVGRRAFLYVIDGALSVNGQMLSRNDQARVTDELQLDILAAQPSELILIDLP
jgi:redox-sensitive bicupin YhaK (pirin superfamily)